MTTLAMFLGIIVFYLVYFFGVALLSVLSDLLLHIPLIGYLFKAFLSMRHDSASTFAVTVSVFVAGLLTYLLIEWVCKKKGNKALAKQVVGTLIAVFAIIAMFGGGSVFANVCLLIAGVCFWVLSFKAA